MSACARSAPENEGLAAVLHQGMMPTMHGLQQASVLHATAGVSSELQQSGMHQRRLPRTPHACTGAATHTPPRQGSPETQGRNISSLPSPAPFLQFLDFPFKSCAATHVVSCTSLRSHISRLTVRGSRLQACCYAKALLKSSLKSSCQTDIPFSLGFRLSLMRRALRHSRGCVL